MRKKARNEKKQTEKAQKSKEQGLWEATDFKTDHYNWMEMFREEEFAQVNLDKNSSRIQILRHFLTDEFLKDVFDFYGPERFTYIDHDSLSTINHGSFSLPLTILYLSVYVLISAHHVVPQRVRENKHALRDQIKNNLDYLKEINSEVYMYSYYLIEKYFSMYNIPHEMFQKLSLNFQSALSGLGRTVCGDEKLLHFTGDSKVVLNIVTKPDSIGIWYYEVVVILPNGTPFLIYLRMRISIPNEDMAVKVIDIIKDWGGIVLRFDKWKSILVFDSYYMVEAGRQWLNENELYYLASFKQMNFRDIVDQLRSLCPHGASKAGQYAAIYRNDSTELAVKYVENSKECYCRFNLSNCFRPVPVRRPYMNVIFGYDHYKEMFPHCDKFNTNLHGRMHPHRTGSGKQPGEEGHANTMAMGSIFMNTFTLYEYLNNIPSTGRGSMHFEDHGVALAQELFQLYVELQEEQKHFVVIEF